ncbi:MAG TPA: LPS export ABC transporter periplasmic protein LptC [Chitinophagaceae bacterium]|nr:LPS export ABC transporter periplasmic protein LptC [Chitinophagaceae bacterium]
MLSANITSKFNRSGRWAILVAGLFALCSCENNVKDIPDMRTKRIALEEGHTIESYLSEHGKVKAKLTAPLMYRYQADSSYVEFPKTLHVDFFNDSLKRESQLDAHYGKYREWENKVYLRDSVVVIDLIKKDTLKSDELWWDQNTQKFYTHTPVHIYKSDGTVIFGKDGMEAPQNFSSWIIYNGNGRGPVPKDAEDSAGAAKDSTPPAPQPLKFVPANPVQKDTAIKKP